MGSNHPRAGSARRGRPSLRSASLQPPKRPGNSGRPPKVLPRPKPLRASGRTPGSERFPCVEPPAPLAGRLSGKAWRRELRSELWRQTPCWLASLVVHLALMVVVASIVVHYARGPAAPSIILAMGAEAEPLNTTFEVVTIVESGQDVEEQDVPDWRAEAERGEGEGEEDDKAPPEPSSEATASEPRPGLPDPFGAAGARGTRPASGQGGPRSSRQQLQDRVIDRFILYDTGKLKGEAGEKARREFERLGPDAIPSLVYGLNRAANIHANCPICVISRKLEAVMAQDDDPAMLKYVVDNLGRDVPEDAPYARRLEEIKRDYAERYAEVEGNERRLREKIASLGFDPHDSDVARETDRLMDATADDLAEVLSDRDPDRRIAGTIVATLRPFPRLQPRARIAAPLVDLLGDPDPRIRGQAHDALVAITHKDFGPRDPHVPESDRTVAIEQWRTQWLKANLRLLEPQAAAALARAETLRDRGRTQAAAKHYRKLITDFPDSRAADEARSRLQLAGLAE